MYDAYIVRRTQIYLDESQADELASRARRRGVTSSHMIREAVDEYLAAPDDERERRLVQFQSALGRSFGTVGRLPDGAVYVSELRRTDRERRQALQERHR